MAAPSPCATHPGVPSTGHCRRCGDFICDTCTLLDPAQGTFICPRCHTRSTDPAVTPNVVYAMRVYCVVFALISLGIAALFATALFSNDPSTQEASGQVIATTLSILFLICALAFTAVPFLPRRPWVWIAHICLIALSMTNPCGILLSAPLMLFWVREDARRYFGQP